MLKFKNEYEAIEINKAGSVNGNGIMITIFNEYGHDVVDPFLNKEQIIELRDYLTKVIESDWLDKE